MRFDSLNAGLTYLSGMPNPSSILHPDHRHNRACRCFHEIKYDGYRLRIERDGGRVRLITRGGYDWTKRFRARNGVGTALRVTGEAHLRRHLPPRVARLAISVGVTTLFAALDVLEGKVIGQCMKRHRHQEFIRFLNVIEARAPKKKTIHIIVAIFQRRPVPNISRTCLLLSAQLRRPGASWPVRATYSV